jgi:hypothetical protein
LLDMYNQVLFPTCSLYAPSLTTLSVWRICFSGSDLGHRRTQTPFQNVSCSFQKSMCGGYTLFNKQSRRKRQSI